MLNPIALDGAAAPARHRRDGQAAVALLAATGLLVVSQLYLPIPLLRLIGVDLAADQVAWTVTAFGLAYAGGFLVFGPLSDRHGPAPVLAPGLVALAVGTIAVAVSPSFGWLVASRAAQGLAAATFAPAALSAVAVLLPAGRRAVGIAAVSTGFLLAGVLGQLYAAAIAGIFGWRAVFWSLAAAYLLVAPLLAVALRHRHVAEASASLGHAYRRMVGLLASRPLVVAYAASLVVLLSFVAAYAGLAAYVSWRFPAEPGALQALRLAGIPGMLLSPLAARLVPRWGAPRTAAGGLLLAASGVAAQAVAPSVPTLALACGVFVAGIALTVPAVIAHVQSWAGGARGAATALYTFALFVGASIGPFVAGPFGAEGFAAMSGILAALLVLAALVLDRGSPPAR